MWEHVPRVLRGTATRVPCRVQRLCRRYLFVVYKHGRHKTAGRPLDQVCRLLRSHVDQHTFSHQECWQPGGDRERHGDTVTRPLSLRDGRQVRLGEPRASTPPVGAVTLVDAHSGMRAKVSGE